MTVVDIKALDLLGKEVSFVFVNDLTDEFYAEKYSGIVTSIILSLNFAPQFSINDFDFFEFSRVKDFVVKS